MAVTSWTDNDSNGVPMDWTNPNLADWRYVDALVQAVNERRSAIGQDLLIFPDYPGRYLNISILQQIHSAVIALIPQYVNHEDNSGNWNGKTAIPLWSFNSIMNSITGNVYQLSSGLSVKNETVKLWSALMYKCLNKLRWISVAGFFGNRDEYYAAGFDSTSLLTAKTNAVNNIIPRKTNEDGEIVPYMPPPPFICDSLLDRYQYVICRTLCDDLTNFKKITAFLNKRWFFFKPTYVCDYTVNSTLYVKVEKFFDSSFFWNSFGLGYSENEIVKVNDFYDYSFLSREYISFGLWPSISCADVLNFYNSNTKYAIAIGIIPNINSRISFILKFDTSGGFAFKDW